MLDAREQAKAWVVFPQQMSEMLHEIFSNFLERLVQFHWEAPEDLLTVTLEDLPIDPDFFVDFQNVNLSAVRSHGRRVGHEIEQYWLEFSWFSHAIQAAHSLDPKIPGDALIWQELANQCRDEDGNEEHARAFAAALNGVAESLRRIGVWANEKAVKLNTRVATGHPLGISIEGLTVRRRDMPRPITVTEKEAAVLKIVVGSAAGTSGAAIARRLGKQIGTLDQAIHRLNKKLSDLGLLIREYRLTATRKANLRTE